MNELAETNRNIGLLEQSIHMTSSPSQADAADYMICEETGRKRQLINHLNELQQECSERRNEISTLRSSAIQEAMTYARIAAKFHDANNQESFEEAMKMRNKARREYDDYGVLAEKLAALSTEINNTLAGETLPRLLPLTNIDDLPFESATALSMTTFEDLAQKHVNDIISYVERHRDLREPDETALTEAVITEISRGKVSAEDVLQSFDEVLDERYAAFYEHLNERYAQNPKFYQSELALCVEAYA